MNKNDSPDFFIPEPKEKKQIVKLSESILIGQRYGYSKRGIAALGSAVMSDLGLLKNNNNSVIDRNKVKRSKVLVNEVVHRRQNKSLTLIRVVFFMVVKMTQFLKKNEELKFVQLLLKKNIFLYY